MPWVYILECSDGSYYVGSTWNVEHRVWQHGQGLGSEYTKVRRPVRLRYAAETGSIQEAYGWERRIHGWSRAKKEALIDGRWSDLPGLAANSVKRRMREEE